MPHRSAIYANDDQVLASPPGIPPRGRNARRRASVAQPLGIFQQLLDGFSEQAALIGDEWTILAVNDAWAETVTLNGLSDFQPGANYYREITKLAGTGSSAVQAVLAALDEIGQGKRRFFRVVYEGGGQQIGKQFEARFTVIDVGDRSYLLVTRYDITERAQLRSLSADVKTMLLKAQEEERRRMGRELHDSGLQLLTCLSLALARLKRAATDDERHAATDEMAELLLMGRREFRAIAYLAHPPQLATVPLREALELLIEGFGQRSGLATTLEVDGLPSDLAPAAEHAVYRVVQEAISNVHRHAGARNLAVRISAGRRMLHVAVIDDGRGIADGVIPGVGLEGMRSRLQELGGRLTMLRRKPGTAVLASLPLSGPATGAGEPDSRVKAAHGRRPSRTPLKGV